jgi:adenylate kinase
VRIVLLGPPGAGKGTQAHRLADRFGLALIATGDIFRQNFRDRTPLGIEAERYMEAGELVPDDIVVGMVMQRLEEPDAQDGFVLDGFPRTVPQAQALDEELARQDRPLTAVLYFSLPEEIAVKRLAGRRTCRSCQRSYNVEFKPPAREGVCDVCGGELIQREDDEEDTVRHRIEVYHRQTEPLVSFFEDQGLLRTVNAAGSVDEVTERAVEAVQDHVQQA